MFYSGTSAPLLNFRFQYQVESHESNPKNDLKPLLFLFSGPPFNYTALGEFSPFSTQMTYLGTTPKMSKLFLYYF